VWVSVSVSVSVSGLPSGAFCFEASCLQERFDGFPVVPLNLDAPALDGSAAGALRLQEACVLGGCRARESLDDDSVAAPSAFSTK